MSIRGDSMGKLIYFGHSCFMFESKNFRVVIDPYSHGSVPNLKMPPRIEADMVICSHDHFDHNAKKLISLTGNKPNVEYFSITVPHDHHFGHRRGFNNINVFNFDGYKIVHLGDTGCVPEERLLTKINNCDILLAPINGYYTIDPQELKQIVDIVKPRIVVPMHYYMEDYKSGISDDDMFNVFKRVFSNYQYIESDTLDLDEYKDYRGSLVFRKYRQ